MALSEFEIIQRYFSAGVTRADVLEGIGDDCALLLVPEGMELAVSIDTLVEGVHFSHDVDAQSLGHKALAVNLSDLAAMAAQPSWVTLALTLPLSDSDWLAGFSRGFLALAEQFGVALVGGDTTRGPLSITVQAHGFIQPGQSLRRSGARVGDLIYVTGTLGDAAAALQVHQGAVIIEGAALAYLTQRLERPQPRLREARVLASAASAAIDVSDGLAADLGHILTASGVGASLYLDHLPISTALGSSVSAELARDLALSGGDDYELCLTVPPDKQRHVEYLGAGFECGLTRIGTIEAASGLRCREPDGLILTRTNPGFDHFRENPK